MKHLIEKNEFEELKKNLTNTTEYKIHLYLLNVLNNKAVEIDGESFSPERYQEEFLEGLNILEALNKSNIERTQFDNFKKILVKLTFNMSICIQKISNNAINKGSYMSESENAFLLDPLIRIRVQDFIELLKTSKNQEVFLANLAAAKIKLSLSIQNQLKKFAIGEDMLQFAKAYEDIGEIKLAMQTYEDILEEFESDSFKSSSGLLPEISIIDIRPESEIKIFEIAKYNLERLTGQKVVDSTGIQINESETSDNMALRMEKTINQSKKNESGFLNKLKRLFKKS